MNIKDLVEKAGYIPKRKAATHGGEFCSPCPFCKEGDDRFLVWPNRYNSDGSYTGGRFYCPRHCRKRGDAITFLCQFHGLSYQNACAMLRIEPKRRNNLSVSRPPSKLQTALDPSVPWSDKAAAFITWCHAKLMDDQFALSQITARGITMGTSDKFKLGYCPTDFWRGYEDWGLSPVIKENGTLKKLWLPAGIVIPTFAPDGRVIKIKVRRTNYEKDMNAYEVAIAKGNNPKWKPQKYVVISGSKESPSTYGDTSLHCALVLESEIDAILVQQEAGNLAYCVALGGNTKPLDLQTDSLLKQTPKLLFCPDYDQGGATAWTRWKKMFLDIERILTPSEKSPGDYYLAGGDLYEWLRESINGEH